MKDPKNGRDNTQKEMGVISNLINDMTLAGANEDEMAAAVRHSMVVIDAGKHKLNYKQSEIDNNISALKKKYQRTVNPDGSIHYGGASTIISRSKGEHQVDRRQGTPKVNIKGKEWYDPTRPEGALIYKTADNLTYEVTKVNKRTGEITTVTKNRRQPSTNMAETDDAYTLVSQDRHPMELLYADYANSMKALANQARKEMIFTGKIEYSKTANEIYKPEVAALKTRLNEAKKNAVRERAAQRMANVYVQDRKEADPNMKKSDVRKVGQRALTKYRQELNASSRRERNIKITDREWEAIQAGAISETILKSILDNTDIAELRQRATPKTTNTLSNAKVNKIRQMNKSNFTLSEIAESLGVSTSTVSKYLKGVN